MARNPEIDGGKSRLTALWMPNGLQQAENPEADRTSPLPERKEGHKNHKSRYRIRSSLSKWRSARGIRHMTWRMWRVAGSIAGRHHRRCEKPQDAECTGRSSGGSCGRWETQWRCLTDCYRLAETWKEKRDNSGGQLRWTVWSSQPGTPAHLYSAKSHFNADKANDNRNRHSEHRDGNDRWWGSYPSTISRFHNIKI